MMATEPTDKELLNAEIRRERQLGKFVRMTEAGAEVFEYIGTAVCDGQYRPILPTNDEKLIEAAKERWPKWAQAGVTFKVNESTTANYCEIRVMSGEIPSAFHFSAPTRAALLKKLKGEP
jgi:hypothetical protein